MGWLLFLGGVSTLPIAAANARVAYNIVKTEAVTDADSKVLVWADVCGRTYGEVPGGGFDIHEVALTTLTAYPNPVRRGRTVTFSYTVRNEGNVTGSGVTFSLSNNGDLLGRPQPIDPISPGMTRVGSLRLRVPRTLAPGDYLLTGSVSLVPGEANAANNMATVKVTVQ